MNNMLKKNKISRVRFREIQTFKKVGAKKQFRA